MDDPSGQVHRRQFVRSGAIGVALGLTGCLRFTNTDSDPQQETTAGNPSVTAPATTPQTADAATATTTASPTRTTPRRTATPEFALEPLTELEAPVAATAHDGMYYTIGYPGVTKLAPDGTDQWASTLDIEHYYPKSGVALTDTSILWGLQASDDVDGTTLGGKVVAFSRATGTNQWEFAVENDGNHHQISGIGTGESDVVAIGADDHGRGDEQDPHVYGVAPSTGEQVWKSTELPAGHIETVVGYSNRFYIVMVGGIFACDPGSGAVRRIADLFSGFGTAGQAGRMLYLPGEPLRAFDLEEESVAWSGNHSYSV